MAKEVKINKYKEKGSDPVIPHHLQIYFINRKGSKDMYNILNQSSDEATRKKIVIWKAQGVPQ